MITAQALAGEWTVARLIADQRTGQPGRFDGIARLTPVAGGLDYAEAGQLTLGTAAPLQAKRGYRWQFDADGVAVFFSDGRAFHRFQPGVSGPGTDHLCGADLYRVRYDWGDWPAWQATWQVTGPAKDYVMTSRHVRAGRADAALAVIGGLGQ